MAGVSQGEHFERVREFALRMEGAREEFTFEFGIPVYKAANGKIFAVVAPQGDAVRVSLKLTPEEVLEALTLPFVRSAPYFSKTHWVMAEVTDEAELEMTLAWVRRSHELVTARPVRTSRRQRAPGP